MGRLFRLNETSREVVFDAVEPETLIQQLRGLKEDEARYENWEMFGALGGLAAFACVGFLLVLWSATLAGKVDDVAGTKTMLWFCLPPSLLGLAGAAYAYRTGRSRRYDPARLDLLVELLRFFKGRGARKLSFEGDLGRMPHNRERMDSFWAKPYTKSGNTYVLTRDWCRLKGELNGMFELSVSTETRFGFGTKDLGHSPSEKNATWVTNSLLQESELSLTAPTGVEQERMESALQGSELTLKEARQRDGTITWLFQTPAREQKLERPFKQLHVDRDLEPKVIRRILENAFATR